MRLELLVMAGVAVVALVVWFCKPISWRDGEGTILNDDGEPIGEWALKRYMRHIFGGWL